MQQSVQLLCVSAGDGRVFFYSFGQDKQRPVKVLDVCGSAVPVYALAFNHAAPEVFAAVETKAVKVCLAHCMQEPVLLVCKLLIKEVPQLPVGGVFCDM